MKKAMKCYCTIISVILFIACCKGQDNSTQKRASYDDTAKTFKKEIPRYGNGSFNIFYGIDRAKEKQLGLDSLQNGFDGIQIRFWYDFSVVQKRRLVIITNKDTSWSATAYDMSVKWNGQTDSIMEKTVQQVTPKSGWAAFSKKLLDLQVLTLPDQDDVAGYGGRLDGDTYNVEAATKMQYRFYGYWLPQLYQDAFWQAKKITEILKIIKDELGVSDTHKPFW